jgi:hypothetical protein
VTWTDHGTDHVTRSDHVTDHVTWTDHVTDHVTWSGQDHVASWSPPHFLESASMFCSGSVPPAPSSSSAGYSHQFSGLDPATLQELGFSSKLPTGEREASLPSYFSSKLPTGERKACLSS